MSSQTYKKYHNQLRATTIARKYVRSPTILLLTTMGILWSSVIGVFAAITFGNEWWIAVTVMPIVLFYAGYLKYRKEDANTRHTSLEMAAEREEWCMCVGCCVNRALALENKEPLDTPSPNSGVDDIIHNTAAGRRYRKVATTQFKYDD